MRIPASPFKLFAICAEDTNPPTPPPITVIVVEVTTFCRMKMSRLILISSYNGQDMLKFHSATYKQARTCSITSPIYSSEDSYTQETKSPGGINITLFLGLKVTFCPMR